MTKKTLHVYALVALITLAVGFSAPHSALGQGVETSGGIGVPPLQKSQSGFTPIVNIPGIPLNADSSIPEILNGLFRLSIVAAGLLAVIYITVGGFEYMVSGAREAKKDGRERIQSAVIGLLLLLSSYIILYVINPDILNLDPFRTTLTPATEQQGPAAPSSGANTGGGGDTPQTPQAGGGTSSLPSRWKSGIDALSLNELKGLESSSCANPKSPFYQGAAKCQYIQDRIQTLEGGAQTPGGGTTQDGMAGAGGITPRASESCAELKPGDATCTIKTDVGKSGKDTQQKAETQCRSAGGVSNTQYYCENSPENKDSVEPFCGISGSPRVVEVTCRAETQSTVTNIASDSWFARARTAARQCQEVNKGNPTYSDCDGANPGTRTSMPFCVSGLGTVSLSVTCTY